MQQIETSCELAPFHYKVDVEYANEQRVKLQTDLWPIVGEKAEDYRHSYYLRKKLLVCIQVPIATRLDNNTCNKKTLNNKLDEEPNLEDSQPILLG